MEDPLAQAWDGSLRKLVHANPQAFVHLVDPEAEYLHAIKEKLKPLTREVDGLLLTQRRDGNRLQATWTCYRLVSSSPL
jgi:hypothetical protein